MLFFMPFTCCVYGLGIQVNEPLSGLRGLPPAREIDVRIQIRSMPSNIDQTQSVDFEEFYVSAHRNADGNPEFRASRSRHCGSVRMVYSDGTVFVIDRTGSSVLATTPVDQTTEDTATYLLGPIMGVVLRLRGVTCLHSSAVAIDGRAVAFVGVSGAGKSTIAAAFARLGFAVLSDDVLAITENDDHFLAHSAYPRIRLWSNSVAGLFGSADSLPLMTLGWDKRFLGLGEHGYRFQSEALPLAAVYFLGKRVVSGGETVIETVNSAEALMALVSDSYATNFQDKPLRSNEFEVLSHLVQDVPLRRASARDDLSSIDEFCDVIVQDFRKQRFSAVTAIL